MTKLLLIAAVAMGCADPIVPMHDKNVFEIRLEPETVVESETTPSRQCCVIPVETIPASRATRRRYRGTPLLPLPPATEANTALFLAKLYFVEVEGPRPIDMAIMVHVLDYRQRALERRWDRPVSLLETIDLYSSGRLRLPPGRRPERYEWILELRPGIDAPPDAFPEGRSWERTAASWEETLAEARQHVRGHLPPDPCEGLAGYWGGRGRLAETTDAPRGTMRPIECHPDQLVRTYSTARTRRRARDS